MEDALVPFVVFSSIIAAIWLFSHYNFKKRHTAHETIRHAIDKGQEVSPELVEKMSYLNDPVKSDLRRGILFIAFGAAFIVLATMISHEEPEGFRPMLGIASFPIILGLAYLGLWRFSHDR